MPRRKQHKSEREKFVPYLEVLAEDHAVSYERPSWLNILKDSNEKSKRNGTSLSQTIKISSVDRKTSQVSDDRVDWNDSPLRQDFSKSYGNGDSTSPLFGFECIFNRDGPGLKSFVDTHEDIQGLVDEFGNNLLLAAVFVGWERAVRFLLKRGLRLDGVNKFGRSALSYAIGMEYYEIRDLLYRKGASLTQ
jgi:ankyrin repeat protein